MKEVTIMNENNKIDILLNGKEYLKNEYVYKRNSIFVKSVLEMKEWDNPKFSGLLTSTIWNSNI